MKTKKSWYLHKKWLKQSEIWQQYVEPLRQQGQFQRAKDFEAKANEYKHRADAATPKAV